MINKARLRANRRNALQSTGAMAETGKIISRRNGLKHGLTGRGEVLTDDEAAAVGRRAAEWADALRPSGGHEQWLARQVVLASLRIERCQELERSRRVLDAARAVACWEDDRRQEAEELGARLSRSLSLVAARLRRTRQGCDWLLARWRKLEAALDGPGGWQEAHRVLALDLLGEPAEGRAADLALLGSASSEELRAIVASEVEALEALKAEALDELDDAERALAEAGLPVEEGAEVRRLRRYEAACWRMMRWAQDRLSTPGRRGPSPMPSRPERPAAAPEAPRPAGRAAGVPDPASHRPSLSPGDAAADRPTLAGESPGPSPSDRRPAASASPAIRATGPDGPIATAPTATDRRAFAPAIAGDRPLNRRARRALKKQARGR